MCDFLSFAIAETEKGLVAVFATSLNSHGDIPYIPNSKGWYECEWTENDHGDSLEIRVPDYVNGGKREALREWVLHRWPTRSAILRHALDTLDWSDAGETALDLSEFPHLTSLPENMHMRALVIDGNKRIKHLPKGLEIVDYLSFERTNIAELPEDFKSFGNMSLYATGSKLASLPDNINLRSAYLSNTPLTSLPHGMRVWHMNIRATEIHSLPDDLIVEDSIFTDAGQLDHKAIPARLVHLIKEI